METVPILCLCSSGIQAELAKLAEPAEYRERIEYEKNDI